MRVVFLTTGCFDKGGISRYSRYQIEALRRVLGPDNVKVLSLLGPNETSFETPFKVNWHGGKGGFRDKLLFAGAATCLALTAKADVVHVAHVNMGPLAINLARLIGAKALLNVYGLEVWSGLTNRRRQAMAGMAGIIADCHFTADFIASEHMHAAQPDVIWDCVDLERFSPGSCAEVVRQKYGLPDKRDSFVIMSLGRLDSRTGKYKGFDRLIEVFAMVHKQLSAARLVIAGEGNDRPRLEELVARHGLSDAVIFTGAVEERDLADCYRAASVFSLVSDRGHGRGEGLPLTPLEAMACGTAIIVGNQDGSQEAVIDGANGFVVGPFDLTSHGKALLSLARSSELLGRLQHAARELAERRFGYERFVEQHRELYSRVMAG